MDGLVDVQKAPRWEMPPISRLVVKTPAHSLRKPGERRQALGDNNRTSPYTVITANEEISILHDPATGWDYPPVILRSGDKVSGYKYFPLRDADGYVVYATPGGVTFSYDGGRHERN